MPPAPVPLVSVDPAVVPVEEAVVVVAGAAVVVVVSPPQPAITKAASASTRTAVNMRRNFRFESMDLPFAWMRSG